MRSSSFSRGGLFPPLQLFAACSRQLPIRSCVWGRRFRWLLGTLAVALGTSGPQLPPAAAQVKEVRRVLILNEVGTAYPGINSVDQGVRAALENSPYRMLNDEKPQDIPVVTHANAYMFDWRALQRWRFKENDLPPGSIWLNRQSTLWESFKWHISGGISLMLAGALLIFGLLFQRARRRAAEKRLILANEQLAAYVIERQRAEATLREGEERFRLVANTAPVMIWMTGPDRLCDYANQSWLDFTGRPIEAELGSGWADGIHPDDVDACLKTFTGEFDQRRAFQMQYRYRRHDGEYRWILDSGVPRFNADGSFAGYIGSCIDITERKLAEDALSNVSRRLIEAHEEERSWIARELHDDVNQRLALLAVSLERTKQALPASAGSPRRQIQEAYTLVQNLGSDVQALTHRLHPSKLDYLGLVAAAAGFCKELSGRKGVEIDFHSRDMPAELPREISLCLFRILQEALQNGMKHSSSRRFEVSLNGGPDEIHLAVRDWGIGFDPKDITERGLGLTSMKERLRLVGGDLVIDSRPQHGTAVHATVPLSTRTQSARA